jgi:recombinational DNA repair ATPase RecF
VKRLRAVTIRPDGSLVQISGRNAQGKTSVLDAIEMALGGAPRPDGRTTFIQVPSDTSAAGLADDLNRHGHTPGTLDAAFGRAEGGRL